MAAAKRRTSSIPAARPSHFRAGPARDRGSGRRGAGRRGGPTRLLGGGATPKVGAATGPASPAGHGAPPPPPLPPRPRVAAAPPPAGPRLRAGGGVDFREDEARL